jgi:glutamyl-tRNA reductase
MGILTIGVSFRRAPIELLERLAFTTDDLGKAYAHAASIEELDETVILSTCNRVEVYASVPSYHAGFLALKRLLAESREVDPEDAADHLFSVAAGLDSMVLGETQIYSQVREAIRRAEAEGTAGRALTGLFHAAGRSGRRVRQETSLGAAPDAFVELGAQIASEALEGLGGRVVTVVGAGQMAALAVKHLRGRGVGPVRILNRSLEHARALAERTGTEHLALEELPQALATSDLVVSATGAAGHVIGRAQVEAATAGRAGHPLILLDLAVPRDVEPSCATLPGVRLIDIVNLRERIGDHDPRTAADIARAHELVAEEVRRWVVRRRGDEMAPLIRALRGRADEVVRAELERFATRLASLTPDERDAVEALARGIAAKLLHDPIVELKERSEPGAAKAHAKLLADLLGVEPES